MAWRASSASTAGRSVSTAAACRLRPSWPTACDCPVLALWGGADRGIGPEVVAEFESALQAAGVEHRSITYPDAPHSFFDRTAAEYANESEDAWRQMLDFVGIGR